MSDTLPAMTPLTALGGTAPVVETSGMAILTEVTNLALASVSSRFGQDDSCKEILADLLGGETPGIEGLVAHQPLSSFWMGPGQWMVVAPHDTHEDLASILKETLGDAASVTEQNDAWGIFDLEGGITKIMELLCPIDMRNFPTGSARRTTIDHLGCFVLRRDDQHLQILGPRSSAGSLHHALLTAMRAVSM